MEPSTKYRSDDTKKECIWQMDSKISGKFKIYESTTINFFAYDHHCVFDIHFIPPLERQTCGRQRHSSRKHIWTVRFTQEMLDAPEPLKNLGKLSLETDRKVCTNCLAYTHGFKKCAKLEHNIIKNTKGRQKKIEIKKMSNKRNLQVTFSKRRTGIFKKASELTTLCGMNLAVIMSSPGNRVFSFGSPSVDSVIQHYTAQGPPPLLNLELNEASIDEHELHVHLNNLSDQIAAEKKHKKDLNRMLNAAEEHVWFVMPIKSMNDAQLETYKKMLEELKTYANEKREKLLQRLPNTSMGVATLTHDFRNDEQDQRKGKEVAGKGSAGKRKGAFDDNMQDRWRPKEKQARCPLVISGDELNAAPRRMDMPDKGQSSRPRVVPQEEMLARN
ncbi:hypothetical protein JHK87_004623 [Glycine soja]|nr:hypothetical protein JHK87_004623 [Glycine soja]